MLSFAIVLEHLDEYVEEGKKDGINEQNILLNNTVTNVLKEQLGEYESRKRRENIEK